MLPVCLPPWAVEGIRHDFEHDDVVMHRFAAVPATNGRPPLFRRVLLQVLAPKSQLLDMTARRAAILYHCAALGIRIASLDLHLLIASNAGDEVRHEAFAFFCGFADRHDSISR